VIRRLRPLWAAILLVPAVLAAQAPAAVGSPTPEAAVERLLKAVADSNLGALADAWGTPAGPASKVKPQRWEQRVALIQAYLRGGTYRVLGTDQTVQALNGRRTILVEMRRDRCLRQIPFNTAQLRDQSWIVTSVDLTAAGVPGKQCEDV
jgi:hypothetical protein